MPAAELQIVTETRRLSAGNCFRLSAGTSPHLFTNMGGLSAMCLHFS